MAFRAGAALLLTASVAAQASLAPPTAHPTPQGADPVAETARLNEEQSDFARRQLAANEASRRAHDRAVQAREAEIAQEQAEFQAAKARNEHDRAQAMAEWRADVQACKAGNRSKCAS